MGFVRGNQQLLVVRAVSGIAALFLGPKVVPNPVKAIEPVPRTGGRGVSRVTPASIPAPSTWRLTVNGLVQNKLQLSFEDFTSLPQLRWTGYLQCDDLLLVERGTWKGVAVHEVLGRAGLDPRAARIVFYSDKGAYKDSLSLEEAARPDFMLAHEQDGLPLAPEHGQPLRLVVPSVYGLKWVKWITRVGAIPGP